MFDFTPKERRALIILLIVLLASAVVQWLLSGQFNTEVYDYSLEDSLFEVLSADTLKTNSRVETPESKKQYKSTYVRKRAEKKPLALHSININTADAVQLKRLPGIGAVTAQAIIDYRQTNGPFKEAQELTKVKRIGKKTLEKIKPFIVLTAGDH